MTARRRYLRARRSRRRHPSRASELMERRCLAAWVAVYSPMAAKVLRGDAIVKKGNR